MNRTSLFLTAGGLFIVIAAGCQAIAGLESRPADPLATGCNLPSSGNGRVRLANMANVAGNTDFCIRPSGSSDWGRPIFRDGGNDALCLGTASQPGGLAYGQATAPFAEPVGKIDVKAIPAGQTCSAAATSQALGIEVGDASTSSVVTLVRWGGGTSAEGMVGLAERPAAASDSHSHTRIINALSDDKSITFGVSQSSFLPATVDKVIISTPIAPGSVPAAQGAGAAAIFAVDSNGYMTALAAQIVLAAAYSTDPTNKAITLYKTAANNSIVATFYVIGDPNDTKNGHVVRGLYCQDALTQANAAADAGGGDAGAGALTAHDQSLLQQCSLAQLEVFSVDMVNTALYGANAPFETLRAGLMPAALAKRVSDLMCVVEVDNQSDRTAIIAAAAGQSDTSLVPPTGTGSASNPGWYPYYYEITTDQTTPPSNSADVKPLPANAPCSPSVVSPGIVDPVFQCVEAKCSSVPGGDDAGVGILQGTTSCLSGPCVGPLGRLYTTPAPTDRTSAAYLADVCVDCALYYFTSELPINLAQTFCETNNTQQPYAFQGQTPSFILSHHPLKNSTSYIFPATGYRRAILKSQVVLEDNSVVDFFCAQLTSPLVDQSLPYTGSYGADGDGINGWQQEQDLQAKEAVAWIQSEIAKDGVPAIVAADIHSDLGSATDGGLDSLSPEVITQFTSAFTPAVPVGYTPTCDYCPSTENPYNQTNTSYELMHTFVSGFPTNATQTETYWGNDLNEVVISQDVPGETTPPSGKGPLLEYWAHNYTILRP